MPAIPDTLPPDGFEVALKAAFTGVRGLGPLALTSNSAAPRLVLFQEHLDMRVLRRRSRRYDEIAAIDARVGWYIRNVTLTFKESWFTFSAALPDEAALKALLAFFSRRGLALSPAARALL